jgi:hypothetical protein
MYRDNDDGTNDEIAKSAHARQVMRIIELSRQDTALDFNAAHAMAEQAAIRVEPEVMLVAWFDGKAKKGHPDAVECLCGKPRRGYQGKHQPPRIRFHFRADGMKGTQWRPMRHDGGRKIHIWHRCP